MNILAELLSALFRRRNPVPTPPTPVASDFQKIILDLINHSRTAKGLSPVSLNAKLNNSAQRFAQDAYTHNLPSHIGSDRSTPGDRMKAEGYQFSWEGECMAWATSPEQAFSELINDRPHYAIIMDSHQKDVGIGQYGNRYVIDFGAIL